MFDLTNVTWGICKNCKHAIARVRKTNTEFTEWLHGVPILFQLKCTNKGCSCGGNGFEIYGRHFENEKCGICGQGEICNCMHPEPQMVIIDGKSI